jgi:putative ABC transport system ATP-binding protein
MGVVFQNYALFPHLTVSENVAFPLQMRHLAAHALKAKVATVLEMVGLAAFSRRFPRELSGGQQQRVAVARALVTDPTLVLADEPTGNLDSAAAEDVLRLFGELHQQGCMVVLITHEAEVAARADRVIRIRDGAIADDEIMASGGFR